MSKLQLYRHTCYRMLFCSSWPCPYADRSLDIQNKLVCRRAGIWLALCAIRFRYDEDQGNLKKKKKK